MNNIVYAGRATYDRPEADGTVTNKKYYGVAPSYYLKNLNENG